MAAVFSRVGNQQRLGAASAPWWHYQEYYVLGGGRYGVVGPLCRRDQLVAEGTK